MMTTVKIIRIKTNDKLGKVLKRLKMQTQVFQFDELDYPMNANKVEKI